MVHGRFVHMRFVHVHVHICVRVYMAAADASCPALQSVGGVVSVCRLLVVLANAGVC